ncbi:type IV pilus assembly protein PilM [Candidatus Kaiserbacteria bacterium]|nr:type IV pilus assembly protein PilM [Candidatus Kaiserbacteria bacterium]
MGIPASMEFFSRAAGAVSHVFSSWFPRPQFLLPPVAGIDISDASIKWIVLGEGATGKEVQAWGREPIPAGVVVSGAIKDAQALAQILRSVKAEAGVECAHAALPEESAYVFSMHVPDGSSREQILSMIEFELENRVPIAPSVAVYDFDKIERHEDGSGEEIGVTVFPRELSDNYAAIFSSAGIELLSLEVEARSIARAVASYAADEPITLLVDFGEMRTGLSVLKRGVPIFTSTVAVGGGSIDHALAEKLSLSFEKATAFKNEEGLLAKDGAHSSGLEVVTGTASALADEVTRHFHYWDTRRNESGDRLTPLEQVFLIGGSANLKGLGDYLAARVQVEVVRPSVWRNVCSFDEYIPPIDRRTSLQFATAVGLALRSI